MSEQMTSTEQAQGVAKEVGIKLSEELRYCKDISYDEMKVRVDEFHKELEHPPTYEEIQVFAKENGGVNCDLFAEAACDLLRKQGLQAERVVIIDKSRTNKDNHAVVDVEDSWWLEPQTGETIPKSDWEGFVDKYSKLMQIDPDNFIAFCSATKSLTYNTEWKLDQE